MRNKRNVSVLKDAQVLDSLKISSPNTMAFTPIIAINISKEEYATGCEIHQPYALTLYKSHKNRPIILYQNAWFEGNELIPSNRLVPSLKESEFDAWLDYMKIYDKSIVHTEWGAEARYKNFYIRWTQYDVLDDDRYQLCAKRMDIGDKSISDEEIGKVLYQLQVMPTIPGLIKGTCKGARELAKATIRETRSFYCCFTWW